MEFSTREMVETIVMPECVDNNVRTESISKSKKQIKTAEPPRPEHRQDDNWSFEDSLRHWGIELN